MIELKLAFPEESFEALKTLTKDMGHTDVDDLIQEALQLTSWARTTVQNGQAIGTIDHTANEFREVWSPGLRHIRDGAT